MNDPNTLMTQLAPMGVTDWHWAAPVLLPGTDCNSAAVTSPDLALAAQRQLVFSLARDADEPAIRQLLDHKLPLNLHYELQGESMKKTLPREPGTTFLVEEILQVCETEGPVEAKRDALNKLLELPDSNVLGLRDIALMRARVTSLEANLKTLSDDLNDAVTALQAAHMALRGRLDQHGSDIDKLKPGQHNTSKLQQA